MRTISPGRNSDDSATNSTRSPSPGAAFSVSRLPSRSSTCCLASSTRSATAASKVEAVRSSPSANRCTAIRAPRHRGITSSTPSPPRRLGSWTKIVLPAAWAVAAASASPQSVCHWRFSAGVVSPSAGTSRIDPDQARAFPPPQLTRMVTGRSGAATSCAAADGSHQPVASASMPSMASMPSNRQPT